MAKLFLLRHGQSEWNILNKVQGQEDTELTDKGRDQAHKLAGRLCDEKIDLIFSSDLKRAHDTAKIIGERLSLDVNVTKDLREIHFGIWQGQELKYIKENHLEKYKLWRSEPHNFTLEEAESLLELQERMVSTANNLIKNNPDKNILIVSHGTAIKTLILGLLDIDISKYNKFSIGNVGLSIIDFREFSPVLVSFNNTNHLREE